MDRWAGRVALVTGASSGIGADFCRCLVKHGLKVIGCARRIERIQATKEEVTNEKGVLIPYACDIGKNEEVTKMFAFIREEYGGVDICINNAGIASTHTLMEGNPAEWNRMMDVNVLTTVRSTQLSVQCMRERGVDDGHIININSMSGHRIPPVSSAHFYCATKFALRAITEGFRRELRELKSSIRVSELSPAVVATEFFQATTGCSSKENKEYYDTHPHLDTSDMNDALIYILSAPPGVEVHDILMRPTEQSM